jgi:hypothetical protein
VANLETRVQGDRRQSAFRIEEKGGQNRVLKLRGSAMPMRPTSWGGKQRVITTWYPGNIEATQQVLGPEEGQTEVKGVWRIRRLEVNKEPVIFKVNGVEEKLTTPEAVREAFESIAREGQLLRVTWGGIIRFGRIIDYDFPHDRLEDIEWKATFVWKSRGATIPRANAQPQGGTQIGALERAYNDFNDAVNDANRSIDAALGLDPTAPGFNLRKMTNAARRIQGAVSRATALADRAVKAVRLPLEIVNSFAAVATDIRAQVQGVVDEVANTPLEFMSTVSNVERAVVAYTSFHTSRVRAQDVAREMYRQEQARLRQVQPQFLDVVVGKQGQSLRDLARRYYGDSDAWQIIADANGLSNSILDGGEVLTIPVQR